MSTFQGSPLSEQQFQQLSSFVAGLNRDQIIWSSGYLAGIYAQVSQSLNEQNIVQSSEPSNNTTDLQVNASDSVSEKILTIIYGSRTGNGEMLAKRMEQSAIDKGFKVNLQNAATYKAKDLQNEKNLVVIVSTHGDGVPPFAARELHEFIHGKRAPKLENTTYAVLALGDSTYYHFCKAGIDFDVQLEKLGGKRLVQRAECDVDFEEQADKWIADTLLAFSGPAIEESKPAPKYTMISSQKSGNSSVETVRYTKKNPFKAAVLEKVNLHGRGSDRKTIHIELATDKAFDYQPGDSAGIIPVNSVALINEVLETTSLSGDTLIDANGKRLTLREALYSEYELSKITKDVVGKYFIYCPSPKLKSLIDNQEQLQKYLHGRDVVDLLSDFPTKVYAEDLIKFLKPLQPRYYSISSSPLSCPGEVHLTVGVVEYQNAGRTKKGTCSSFLSDIEVENEEVPIFIESNPGFRLPEDNKTPIIMVGAGTGIAPYRAFVQHREELGDSGKSWLFFGNRHFETEFLYQTEWQEFLKSGALTRMDVAFSRDGDDKKYVQHRLLENASEVYQWLEEGAHFYICGDMKFMAADVEKALVEIVKNQASISDEEATKYVDNLQQEKRLQLDVY
jgi:sulfite reductase (NADPH) flavoprotein alpha-component